MNQSAPAVIFDVDGTLVDSNYLHTIAWWRGLRDCGEVVAMSAVHPLIGMGSDQLVKRLLGHDVAGADQAHGRHYDAFKDELVAFSRAADLLREVARRGATVILATSSEEKDIPRLREVIGAGEAISHVVSKGDVARSKPAPDIFATAIEQLEIDAGRTLAIGDTPWDIEAASKLAIPCVAVLTGGHTRERLHQTGAIAVYRDVAELLACLDDSPIATLIESTRRDGERDLPVIASLAELAGLVAERGSLYLRYSGGPDDDAHRTSRDHESGLALPGLSTNPLQPEPWWTRPLEDWLARQVCNYVHLQEAEDESRYGWVLDGAVVASGPDNEPIVRHVVPVARLSQDVIEEARRHYKSRFEVGRDSQAATPK